MRRYLVYLEDDHLLLKETMMGYNKLSDYVRLFDENPAANYLR